MMIMRTAPDAARAQREDSKNLHQPFREPRFRQNGVMLLIVVNDEKPQDKQAAEDAAYRPDERMKMPQRSTNRRDQKERRRKNAPPASERIVFGKRFRRENEFLAGSEVSRRQFFRDSSILTR